VLWTIPQGQALAQGFARLAAVSGMSTNQTKNKAIKEPSTVEARLLTGRGSQVCLLTPRLAEGIGNIARNTRGSESRQVYASASAAFDVPPASFISKPDGPSCSTGEETTHEYPPGVLITADRQDFPLGRPAVPRALSMMW
jgi:hypothetical protein